MIFAPIVPSTPRCTKIGLCSLITAACLGLGLIASAFTESLPFIYATYGVLVGAGVGLGTDVVMSVTLKWFPDKAGSISGLVQAGASCGPFIMSPIAQWLIDTYGAQMACRILAVVFLIGVGAVAWMIVPCPEGWMPEAPPRQKS